MDKLSSLIFSRYKEVHGDHTQRNDDAALLQREFSAYGQMNYWPHIQSRPKDAAIFEVGTYLGHTVKWLQNQGFTNISGIELDPTSAKATESYTGVHVIQDDVMKFLPSAQARYDVILMKAVLEHVSRDETPELLDMLNRALKPGGILIIAVPNMDWLMAGHERYLDITHRMGYTRESLAATMRLFYDNVSVEPFYMENYVGLYGAYRKIMRRVAIAFTRQHLTWLGEGARETWFEYRSIKGIGYHRP